MAISITPEWDVILEWFEAEKGCRVALANYTRNVEVLCDCGFQTVIKVRHPQPIQEVLDDLEAIGCIAPDTLVPTA